MTNYNERLDEIFAPIIDSPSLTLTTTYWDEAKQAITSLIKELVAEARIDELEKFVNTTNRSLSVKKLRDRLSELKAQQEEV